MGGGKEGWENFIACISSMALGSMNLTSSNILGNLGLSLLAKIYPLLRICEIVEFRNLEHTDDLNYHITSKMHDCGHLIMRKKT